MEFREVDAIPGKKRNKIKRRKACKNEKRLIRFYNQHIAIAEIVDWEKDYANARILYEAFHIATRRFTYLPVDVCKREDKVYLIRTDME